ncbi:glycosyltransferase [Maribacter sp.]|uniref:glycosyltransferase n=1 Tax=Maribacter sp. TaxID=1897614 RepID=UPI0025BE17C7|nr:glycosyltransferase [Maribacter sp.]
MNHKICCIFNIGAHYRAPIYSLMDKELECSFYFGDTVFTPIKTMDYSLLKGYKKTVKNKKIAKGWVWQSNVWQLIFKPYKYYIINSSPYYASNWVILLLAKLSGKKVFAWTHGIKGGETGKSKFLNKVFYKLCDTVLLYGEKSMRTMIKEGFNKNKLVPIYNSLYYDEQLEVRKKLVPSEIYSNHFKNDAPTLIYIGRIQKSKKLDLLVKAVHLINKEERKCNLVFIGKEVEDNEIQSLVNELNITEQVWFYGSSYNETEIGELLYNAAVCVSPGPVGLTAIHAATYGLPIISNDDFYNQMPEHEVIKEGESGGFYKDGDFEDLCLKINDWIDSNPNKRQKAENQLHRIIDEKYNPHYQIKVLKQVLNYS